MEIINARTAVAQSAARVDAVLVQRTRPRVLITVNSPPPPSWHRVLYHLVHGETEEVVPGHVELVHVLWELGILPDIRVLPLPATSWRHAFLYVQFGQESLMPSIPKVRYEPV